MIRNTKQRDAIRRAIQEAGRPLSAAEVLSLAGLYAPGLGIATVYRTLSHFLEEGSVAAVPIPGEPPRYESRDAASPAAPSSFPLRRLRSGLRRAWVSSRAGSTGPARFLDQRPRPVAPWRMFRVSTRPSGS